MGVPIETIIVVEDTPHCAQWQMEAMHATFPDYEVIHVESLEEARQLFRDGAHHVAAVLTDNGYPGVPGGERIGSKTPEGGAGTLLTKLIRRGKMGNEYRDVPIVWHTARLDEGKTSRVMAYLGHTRCFEKGEGMEAYLPMGKQLKRWIH